MDALQGFAGFVLAQLRVRLPVISPESDKQLADRLVRLLHSRVKSQKDKDVLGYLDKLFPPLELHPEDYHHPVDVRCSYSLEEFLEFFDIQLLEACYARIFKRDTDPSGLADGLQAMRHENCSRILMIGRLRYSEEGERHGVVISGLRFHYFFARLRRLPVVGRLFVYLSGLNRIARLDLEAQQLTQKSYAFNRSLEQTTETVTQLIDGVKLPQATMSELGATGDAHSGDASAAEPAGGLSATASSGSFQLALLLGLQREKFVQAAYRVAFERSPDTHELVDALGVLDSGEKSKLLFLGDLLSSIGSVRSIDNVTGLRSAYRREKLYALPVIGFCARALRGLLMLPKVEKALDYQSREIAHCSAEFAEYQRALQVSYNDSVMRLRMEILQALEADAAKQGKE